MNTILTSFGDDQSRLSLAGSLRGHNDWVTRVVTAPNYPNRLVSTSRDKSILIWKITFGGNEVIGEPLRRLTGHSHFVSDICLSMDSDFALTASWDKTIRLWDFNRGISTKRFVGHTNDVLGVSFSSDNRQIVSGGRDNTIRLWNTIGHCKYIMNQDAGHNDWVSNVKISPSCGSQPPTVISTGWDKSIKIWNLASCELLSTLQGHKNSVLSMDLSPDGSLLATGGKDSLICLWDMATSKLLYYLSFPGDVNALQFNPHRYWLAAADGDSIILYHLETREPFEQVKCGSTGTTFSTPENVSSTLLYQTLSMAWSADGNVLFSGHSDGVIRIWKIIN